jgi:hypothetical protein
MRFLNDHPTQKNRLKKFFLAPEIQLSSTTRLNPILRLIDGNPFNNLSSREQQIYDDLVAAINQKKKAK